MAISLVPHILALLAAARTPAGISAPPGVPTNQTPAQILQGLHALQAHQQAMKRDDPYGLAFGPKQPPFGHRPFLRPAPPVTGFTHNGMWGWGASGWDWGRGPGTYMGGAIPKRYGLQNYEYDPVPPAVRG